MASLKIRSALSRLFQAAFVEEARSIFRKVDDELAYEITSVGQLGRTPSRFDRLLGSLLNVESGKEDWPSEYRALLRHALGGVVVHHTYKLLDEIERSCRGDVTPKGQLRIDFAGETENRLAVLAGEMARTRRAEEMYDKGRTWLVRGFFLCAAAMVISIVPMFVDRVWANWWAISSLALFAIVWLATVGAICRTLSGYRWLKDKADRMSQPAAAIAPDKEV